MPQQDPWAEAAKQMKGGQPAAPTNDSATDDWKVFNADSATPPPSTGSQVIGALKNVGIGALKGAGSTLNSIGSLLYPDFIAKHFTGVETPQDQELLTPHGTAQKVGKGIEQTGEFLLPGLGEEAATADLAKAAPKLAPLGRIGYQALTSGAVNKLQGGSFGVGAATGAGGGIVGEGMRAIAPHIAGSALNIRKLDRAYGRAPGQAILDETKGFSPEKVAESAQSRLNDLMPKLESVVDKASAKPSPVRGILPPPPTELLTGDPIDPDVAGELIPAAKMPVQNVAVRPEASYVSVLPRNDAFMTSGTREAADLPRSGPGVLLRRPNLEPFDPPATVPNRSASLRPARDAVNDAISTATRQNAGGTVGQLTPLRNFLTTRFDTGEEIPEMVTPRQLLDLKRGLNEDYVGSWNPETKPGVTSTARRAYGAMARELHDVVPESAELDKRASSLIPVVKRGESTALNAPMSQRVMHRIGAHTGALTGATLGSIAGYREGGGEGAVIGGIGGLVLPELIANPTTEMMWARGLNGGRRLVPRLASGAVLQADRDE